jgi:small-conductance mechanosensitive channel
MDILNTLSIKVSSLFSLNSQYIYLILLTILLFVILKVIGKIIVIIYKADHHSSKDLFIFNQRINITINLLIIFGLFIIWEGHIKNFITLLSFISAGITIAIKDIILNMFAGIYIKVRKPFKLEDRIEINEVKGDVVVINALSFKILEIGDRINGEQSSGIIVNIPNSFIFSYALKNYTTAFKYIWDEIVVKIPLKSDVNKIKEELLSIVNNNEIVEAIPRKMDKAVKESSLEYRIYYNHLDPIIYTKVVDDHIELDIRFLVHPKKIRTVENDVWLEILKKYDEKKIDLFFNNN